jgi:C1A family cysteine protease
MEAFMAQHAYGWVRDLPDHRDRYSVFQLPGRLPDRVDLRAGFGSFPVYDQGLLGSCTANAIAAALVYQQLQQRVQKLVEPSRLWIYYEERKREGTTASDAGAQIRDGIKVVVSEGFPPEEEWPYDPSKFADPPPPKTYEDAKRDLVTAYVRLVQLEQMLMGALAQGHPFIFGISVYESFEQAQDGDIPMPQPDEQLLGGHAILATGYDRKERRFSFRNSWGSDWGDKGYGTIPFEYLTNPNLAADFWVIRQEHIS